MEKVVLYGSLLVLGYFYISRLLGFILRKNNWGFWYRNFYLKSPHWRFLRWRKTVQVILRYGYDCCEKCGSTRFLQTHHKTYERIGRERLSDLVRICNTCHKKEHKL